jgi:hypothetical protein
MDLNKGIYAYSMCYIIYIFDNNNSCIKDYSTTKRPSFIISVRFLTSVIIFLGYCFQYMIKINISIGSLKIM